MYLFSTERNLRKFKDSQIESAFIPVHFLKEIQFESAASCMK